MNPSPLVQLAGRLMKVPAAPFHEHAVRDEVERICAENGIGVERDPFGNLLMEFKRGRVKRPLALVAHLDHPGFEIVRSLGKRRFHARFLGGVGPEYFRLGTRVRLMPGRESARLIRKRRAEKEFELGTDMAVEAQPAFAVWELEDVAVRGGKIHGRSCDDLIGVAAILSTFIETAHGDGPAWLVGAITRAEEIGFGGALSLARSDTLPRNALVVSLETSKELPGVKMGDGVILRVGDRSTVFDSDATRFLHEVALGLAGEDRKFKCQRALMGGGSCEGTVFAGAGYQTAAVCVALGNYHNCGPGKRIREEFVSLPDAKSMVRLLRAAAVRMNRFPNLIGKLPARLEKIRRSTAGRLRRTAESGINGETG
jgi:endoglucanase